MKASRLSSESWPAQMFIAAQFLALAENQATRKFAVKAAETVEGALLVSTTPFI